MAEFKRTTELQRLMLNKLTAVVKDYLEAVEKPQGSRHRKTTFVFVGDRYKPQTIEARFVLTKSKKDE